MSSKNQTDTILQAYFNIRLASYLTVHDRLGFKSVRLIRLEQTVNQYIEDYDADIYPSGFFMDQMQRKGIDVRSVANGIPARQRMMLAYGSRIPKRISPQDMLAIRTTVQTYLAVSCYALNKDMRVSIRNLREQYLPHILFIVECLAEKNRLQVEDIVYVLADECDYIDPRYAKTCS